MSGTAGLGAGTTEAVVVVTPMEVVKIRLQAQQHSLADPLETPRYRNAGHAVYTIVREEGVLALYRGVSLTAIRQATNQGRYLARKFICYHYRSKLDIFRSKLYGIPRNQEARTQMAARVDRTSLLPTHDNRSHLRSNGTFFQCSDRYHQNS
jgi:hypothetical protein